MLLLYTALGIYEHNMRWPMPSKSSRAIHWHKPIRILALLAPAIRIDPQITPPLLLRLRLLREKCDTLQIHQHWVKVSETPRLLGFLKWSTGVAFPPSDYTTVQTTLRAAHHVNQVTRDSLLVASSHWLIPQPGPHLGSSPPNQRGSTCGPSKFYEYEWQTFATSRGCQ